MNRQRFEPLAVAIFGPDAAPDAIDRVQADYRARFGATAGVQVRRYTRAVKAGGVAAPVVVVVARRDRLYNARGRA